jgi:hypothetical protein
MMARNTPAPRDAADRGSTGRAQQVRPRGMVTVALPVEVTTGTTRLQRADVLRYDDAHLIDRMHALAQLTDRQHENACAFLAMWEAAHVMPRVTARFVAAPPGRETGRDPDAATPADMMRYTLRQLGQHRAALLVGLCMGDHPGVQWLATAQAALDMLDGLKAKWDGLRWKVEAEE